MVLYEDIKVCIADIFDNHKIQSLKGDKVKIIKFLTDYIEKLIFNIVATCCMICYKVGILKLTETHFIYMKKHIDKRCSMGKTKSFSGGTFNTASFYGIEEPRYSVNNKMGNVADINFDKNIARPELGFLGYKMGGGGNPKSCNKLEKIVKRKIINIFKFFKINTTKSVRDLFNKIFHEYLNSLIKMLIKSKGELTLIKVKKMLSKSKIIKK